MSVEQQVEALVDAGRIDEAVARVEVLLAHEARPPALLAVAATAYAAAGRWERAVAALEQAVALRPAEAALRSNLGFALQQAGRSVEAVAQLRQALALQPTLAAAHTNLGSALLALGEADEAIGLLARRMTLGPVDPQAFSELLLAMHYSERIGAGQLATAHRRYGELLEGGVRSPSRVPARGWEPARRLRLGFVSSDLRRHPVAQFVEPLWTHLDRSHFDSVAYFNHPRADEVSERLRGLVTQWHDVHALDDAALEARVRADGIDILIDLNGHTPGNRLPLFARRPAPVQVTWLGYPDTTGLRAIDHRITDAVADPPGATEAFHTERLRRLDAPFLCYRPTDGAPAVQPRPQAAPGAVTFGCFNNRAKITAGAVIAWASLLRELPAARLVLKARGLDDGSARAELLQRFAAQGVGADRLSVLGFTEDPVAHLARYHEVDIALDTFPYAGTTTTCDALWMGVPVVTLAGEHHASRVGASLLGAVGLGELVADEPAGYVRRARALAGDPARLAELRGTLRARMAVSGLVDGEAFAVRFSAALRDMWLDGCLHHGAVTRAP